MRQGVTLQNTPETVRGTDIVTITNRDLHTHYALLKVVISNDLE